MPFVLALLLVAVQVPTKETLAGARNVTRVDAAVMCGGATTPEAFPALSKLGFTSILNLRRENEPGVDLPAARAAAADAGLKYLHVPVDGADPSKESVEAFLAAVTQKSNHPIYIHCGSANRVGAMWLIKRVVIDGWDVDRATKEADAIGLTNPALRQFARDYAAAHRR